MVMGPGPGNIPLYSTDSVTFIKTRMDDNSWFISPLLHYEMQLSCLPSIEKHTLAKIYLKNRKSFMFNVLKQSFIYTMHLDFDANNSPKPSSVTPFRIYMVHLHRQCERVVICTKKMCIYVIRKNMYITLHIFLFIQFSVPRFSNTQWPWVPINRSNF